jgi:hypothetical protein
MTTDNESPQPLFGLKEAAAFRKAAASRGLSVSFLGRDIIVEWLKDNGWLKEPKTRRNVG